MLSGLLIAKLHRPPPPLKQVCRPQLVQRLNEGLVAGRRLTLVSAPPGFGKTTCVAEWVHSLDSSSSDWSVAWLSLEPADDDPGRFFAYLLAALQEVDKTIGVELAGVLQAGQLPPTLSLTTTLLNDIVRVGRKFILVLDDFHTLRAPIILDALGRLLGVGPDNLHLVLITREDPLLPLARLRANNQLTEIRAADLRFGRDEAAVFLNELMELALSEADIAALTNRTEGWVAGLQLAALSMRGRSDLSAFIAGLSGSHHYILAYLTEEVLDRQSPDVRAFLLQTSILDRLNGDLCAAVVAFDSQELGAESMRCAALLERLYGANLFLIPLDDEHTWHRYHHLFAHLLSTRLRQTFPPDEVLALHRRAGEWFERNEYTDEAIRHALTAHDFGRAVTLVEQVARAMIFGGRMDTLRDWLAAFPADICTAHPRLAVYRTWIDLLQGKLDLDGKAVQEREAALRSLPPSPENDRLRVELTVLLCRCSPIFGDTASTTRLAQETLQALPEADSVTRAHLIFALAVAYLLEGNSAEGWKAFDECLRLARAAGDDGLIVEIRHLMAQDSANHGRLSEAARHYQAIIDLGKSAAQAPSVVMLRSNIFGKGTAWVGIVFYALGVVPAMAGTVGAICSLASVPPMVVWLVLVARKLFQVAREGR